MTAVPKLQIENIGKTFFKTVRDKTIAVPVLAHVSFSVDPGSFVSVIGPSGCGKSTLLRIIDGLIHADEGKVLVDGRLVTEPGIDRAVVFQYFGLYPWRDVLGNVAFGLELQNVPKQARSTRSGWSASKGSSTTTRTSSAAACGSAWASPARSRSIPKSSSWTNRS